MTQMNHGDKFTHDGKQYTYYEPDKPVIFDPPAEALVWDDPDGPTLDEELARDLIFYDRRPDSFRAIGVHTAWKYMALPAPDDSDELMTHEELAELLACGYGMGKIDDYVLGAIAASLSSLNNPVKDETTVKRFRAAEWVKPTKRVYREFMREIGRPVN